MTHAALKDLSAAVLAARSHIGARRPDERHDPEDAKQWDDLTAAAAALSAVEGEAVVWQMRRTSTVTGEWLAWAECDEETHSDIQAGKYSTNPDVTYESRALYTAPPPQQAEIPEHIRKLVGRIDCYRLCMSYNESYFGEPPGLLKGVFSELAHAMNPIYPSGKTALYLAAPSFPGVVIATAEHPQGVPADDLIATQPQQAGGVYVCDYCGRDYTDAKYCCQRRREYMNAHGRYDSTPPQPEAGGGVRELLREAADSVKASIAEEGITEGRREYRRNLHARLTAALSTTPASGGEHGR